jgi:hypothetical protein
VAKMCYSLLRFICKDLPLPAASPGCDRHFSQADYRKGIGAAQVCTVTDPHASLDAPTVQSTNLTDA